MKSITDTSFPPIHHDFTINGMRYADQKIDSISKALVDQGEANDQEVGAFLNDWTNAKSYITVRTSGSTGTPKEMKIAKQYMINSAQATGDFFKVKEGTTALLCLSLGYIAGKMMLIRAMTLGWKIDLIPPKTNPLDTVYKQYDFCAMVPLQLDNSLNRLHLIKKLIVGGGCVSEALKKRIEGIPTKIYETYGMTETVSHIAAKRLNPKKKESIAKTHFKALPNISLTVDHRDCLVIKAPLLAAKQVVTNDVVHLKTYKKFIWKGRYDNVINSGGVKLYPEEIEIKLQPYIDHRFFITSIPNAVLGDELVLVVEHFDDSKVQVIIPAKLESIKELSKYELPKRIYTCTKFIETENGKIQRTKTLEYIISL